MNVIKFQKEINLNKKLSIDDDQQKNSSEKNTLLYQAYEKLGDAYCNLGLYEQGLISYFEQVLIFIFVLQVINDNNNEKL